MRKNGAKKSPIREKVIKENIYKDNLKLPWKLSWIVGISDKSCILIYETTFVLIESLKNTVA